MVIFDKQQPDYQLLGLLRRKRIECILDVGANRGQFAEYVRLQGYDREIHSFEPLPDAFACLESVAAKNCRHHAHNFALSNTNGTATLRVGANDQTSSLVAASSNLHNAATTPFVSELKIDCARLDTLIETGRLAVPDFSRTLLKLDVQGHEAAVLDGAGRFLDKFGGVLAEASLVEIYDGEASMTELSESLRGLGFGILSFKGGLHHPVHGFLMQIDMLFENLIGSPDALEALNGSISSLAEVESNKQDRHE